MIERRDIRQVIGSISLLVSTLDVDELAELFAETRDNRHDDPREYLFIRSVVAFRQSIANWLDDEDYIAEFDAACDRAQNATY